MLLADGSETTFALPLGVVVRLVMAGLLGAAIGIEREATEQPAGLRTHIAVALGACLFGVISTVGFLEFADDPGNRIRVDVTRVASNVVVGIGFIGAGVIFRRGSTVKNLTTAASLWAVAAVGLACGVGDLGTATVAAALLLGSLVLLRPLRNLVQRRLTRSTRVMRLTLSPGTDPTMFTDAIAAIAGASVQEITFAKEDGHVVLLATVRSDPAGVRQWMTTVANREDVQSLAET